MNAYILGLEKGFRGNNLVDYFVRVGMQPEIVFGVDARISKEYLIEKMANSKKIKRIMGRELSTAEAAVVLGHRMVYERFLQTSDEWALVLEDDSLPNLNFELKDIAFSGFSSPMIVHLGGIENLFKFYGTTKCLSINIINLSSTKKNFFAHRILGNIFGTYAYLINRRAAEIAIRSFDSVDSTADWPYAWRSKVNFYLPEKCFFDVSLEGSLVQEGRDEHVRLASERPNLKRKYKIALQLNTILGLLGIMSIHRIFQGLSFKQSYKEEYLYPFLLRRGHSGERIF